ncbi:patatin-like phospholipase family protein [Hoyosella sp. G463]|uniref:Patatin-like phospholipase family protein n=1 Tax=Lolliginicoccus lacisalsi TaxID=2742202 RepID=A0A927PMS7_9ACTN|nr:patatin-like phospholipase family protein [Lolliginicoccus lacisalsi]MBD8506766.1 patatin-like phospholipase family protein [Lolliginicoccus lacisalsi]
MHSFSRPQRTVLDILRHRRAFASTARDRADDHKVALVIEGGGARGSYSGGMVATLEKLGYSTAFDAVFGTSAGALNAAWFLAGTANEHLWTWWEPRVVHRILEPRRLLTGGRAFDIEHLVETIYTTIAPMDFAAIGAHHTTLHPVATELATGAATDLHRHTRTPAGIRAALRASCALPLVAGPPVHLGGQRYLDGGLAESVPLGSALAWGATHVLVLRTRSAAHALAGNSGLSALMEVLAVHGYLARQSRAAVQAWTGRAERAEQLEEILGRPSPAFSVIRPPDTAPMVGTGERDEQLLRTAVRIGAAQVDVVLGDGARSLEGARG